MNQSRLEDVKSVQLAKSAEKSAEKGTHDRKSWIGTSWVNRARLQQMVFWAIAADFAILYLGAVRFDSPALIITGLCILLVASTVAIASF